MSSVCSLGVRSYQVQDSSIEITATAGNFVHACNYYLIVECLRLPGEARVRLFTKDICCRGSLTPKSRQWQPTTLLEPLPSSGCGAAWRRITRSDSMAPCC